MRTVNTNPPVVILFYLLALLLWPLGASGQDLCFDTGLPSNPYPSIWGTHTATFTPTHDMVIGSARTATTSQSLGQINSVEFSLNGTVIGSGTGGTLNAPATFNPPLALYGGVTYGLQVKTYSYPQLFHVSEIAVADGTISNIHFVDAGSNYTWSAFPVLRLYGPAVPPPTNGPPLKIFRAEVTARAILIWPTNPAGFTLQSTTNLVTPIVWSSNLPPPAIINGENWVTDTNFGPLQRFYRLRKP